MECLYPQTKFRRESGTRLYFEHRCGQCMNCRITRRNEWTFRILVESMYHLASSFITITMRPEYWLVNPYPSLNLEVYQDFLKRFRWHAWDLFKLKPRFFGVGEYGSTQYRVAGMPHYHFAFFGINFLQSRKVLEKAWTYGRMSASELNAERSGYLAGYCVKKMTKNRLPDWDPRLEEFATMSRMPGVGVHHAKKVSDNLIAYGIDFLDDRGFLDHGKLPNYVKYRGSSWPLDTFLREKIAEQLIEQGYKSPTDYVKAVRHHLRLHFQPYRVPEQKEVDRLDGEVVASRKLKRRQERL